MKKTLLTLVIAGSFVLAGCSSSGSAGSSNGDNVVDRPQPQVPVIPDIDNSPEWGLDTGITPDRPEPNDPDWGLDMGNAPDRNPPTWSGPDNSGNTPDRLPPVWGGPEMPPISGGPEATYTVVGNTIVDANGNIYQISDIDWKSQSFFLTDKDGNTYEVRTLKQGEYEGDFGVMINGEAIFFSRDSLKGGIQPSMEGHNTAVDRQSIRDTIRARLNK